MCLVCVCSGADCTVPPQSCQTEKCTVVRYSYSPKLYYLYWVLFLILDNSGYPLSLSLFMYVGRCRLPGCLLNLASVSAKLLRGYTSGLITCAFCHDPLTFTPLGAAVVTFRIGSQLFCPTVGLTCCALLEVMATLRFTHRSLSTLSAESVS